MKKLRVILTILAVLVLLLIPLAALADTAPESTVATGLVWGDGINANFSHNTWYSAGRHWVMSVEYDIATPGVRYYSTEDYGDTWDYTVLPNTQNTLFRGLAVWYDEALDLVHYARVEVGNATDDNIYYRAGTPDTYGVITWEGAETLIESGVGGKVLAVTIACDRNSYPYIAWTEDEVDGGNLTGYYWPEVIASSTNDGTWVDDMDAREEFDGSYMSGEAAEHDYDTLYGAGNWTATGVNLTPIEAAGTNLMQLSWSILETNGTDTAGVDSAIYDTFLSGYDACQWIVPPDDTTGLYIDTRGLIAFDSYNDDDMTYFVYSDWVGQLQFNTKLSTDDWEDINGSGNWTEIMTTGGYNFPTISGYAGDGLIDPDDLIVVYHDQDSLYYDTKAYGGNFTGTWTEIWDVDDHTANPAHLVFLHNTQYRYGAGSPVGFAWDWGTLEWGNSSQTGELDYWWIDQDGVAAGENPLGYYQGTPASDSFGLAWLMMGFLGVIILLMVVVSLFRTESKEPQNYLIIAIMGLLAATIVIALVQSFS